MTTVIEFENDTTARNILGRLQQWGYDIDLEQEGDALEYKVGEKQ